MFNQPTIIRVNRQASNPLVVQAIFYDNQEQSGFILDKLAGKFECLCPFCSGFTSQITGNHFIQQKLPNVKR
jgi:hypothetical protein